MSKKDGKGRFLLIFSVFIIGVLCMAAAGAAMQATDGPRLCASCHAMEEAVWTHSLSSHSAFACNECHTPYNAGGHFYFKAKTGVADLFHNTFSDIADTIHATDATKDVIQANCRRCHMASTGTVAMDNKKYCTECHRSVPHMKQIPIDRRKAADA